MTFDFWYEELRAFMNKKECYSGMSLEPDDWCSVNEWKAHFNRRETIQEAYLAEC